MQQRWSANEKEAFSVYQSVLLFDLCLRGAECILCCHHKPFEPFLSKGINIPKFHRWSMEFTDYKLSTLRGKNNVLVDAFSRLNMLDINKEPMANPEIPDVTNMQKYFMEVHATNMHTLSTTMLYIEEKLDINFKKKVASQLCHINKGIFKSVIMSVNWYPTKTKIYSCFETWCHHNSTVTSDQLFYMSDRTLKVIRDPFICLRQ